MKKIIIGFAFAALVMLALTACGENSVSGKNGGSVGDNSGGDKNAVFAEPKDLSYDTFVSKQKESSTTTTAKTTMKTTATTTKQSDKTSTKMKAEPIFTTSERSVNDDAPLFAFAPGYDADDDLSQLISDDDEYDATAAAKHEREGYEDGKKDGLNGSYQAGYRNSFSGDWGDDNAGQNYIDGYETGYNENKNGGAPDTVENRVYDDAKLEEAMSNTAQGREAYVDWLGEFMINSTLDISSYKPFSARSNPVTDYPRYGKFSLMYGSLLDGEPDGYCIMYPYAGTGEYGVIDIDFDSESVEGYFVDGKLNGKGVVSVNDPDSQFGYSYLAKGTYKDGVPDGVISITDKIKGDYRGEISMGVQHGLGKYMDIDDNWWGGRWDNGELVMGAMYDISNKITVYGSFENGVVQGVGGMMVENGDMWFGVFNDGIMTDVLGYDEYTEEERAASASATAEAMRRIDAIFDGYESSINDIQTRTQNNITRYDARLETSKPRPRIVQVPTYGMKYEGSATTQTWGYAIANE